MCAPSFAFFTRNEPRPEDQTGGRNPLRNRETGHRKIAHLSTSPCRTGRTLLKDASWVSCDWSFVPEWDHRHLCPQLRVQLVGAYGPGANVGMEVLIVSASTEVFKYVIRNQPPRVSVERGVPRQGTRKKSLPPSSGPPDAAGLTTRPGRAIFGGCLGSIKYKGTR